MARLTESMCRFKIMLNSSLDTTTKLSISRIKYAKMQLAKILVRPTEERNLNAGLS
jgi:hypothetical protein